jgi:hypothetical protein
MSTGFTIEVFNADGVLVEGSSYPDNLRSIGELKTGLDALARSNEKHAAKIDSLNETVHTAKGFLKAIVWIGGIGGAIGLTLLGAIFKTLGDHFSKH